MPCREEVKNMEKAVLRRLDTYEKTPNGVLIQISLLVTGCE